MQKILLLLVAISLQFSRGLYIKSSIENNLNKAVVTDDKWNIFKRELGLTDEKVELLKSQKNQKTTIELLNQYMKKYKEHQGIKTPIDKDKKSEFSSMYNAIRKLFKKFKSTLKTSLNFELTDASKMIKVHRRPRRKIAVKMVSDMSSSQIGEILKAFNIPGDVPNYSSQNHDNNYDDYTNVNAPTSSNDDDDDYSYDNLNDAEDFTGKSYGNFGFGSLQDLIIQATQRRIEEEKEATKLQ